MKVFVPLVRLTATFLFPETPFALNVKTYEPLSCTNDLVGVLSKNMLTLTESPGFVAVRRPDCLPSVAGGKSLVSAVNEPPPTVVSQSPPRGQPTSGGIVVLTSM